MEEFDIIEIARDFGLVQVKERGREKIFRCPFCGDSKRKTHGHLHINAERNVFKCHRCGEEGNVLQLYAYLRGISTKEAYKELKHGRDYKPYKIPRRIPLVDEEKLEYKTYPVYEEMMKILPLYDRHLKALVARGFTEDYAKANFRSIPDSPQERQEIIRKLLHKFGTLKNTPGYFTKAGRWEMMGAPGILVPVKTPAGKIAGFQIRRDNPGIITVYGEGEIKVRVEYEDENVEIAFTACQENGKAVVAGKKSLKVIYPNKVRVGTTIRIRVIHEGEEITDDAEYSIYGPAVMNTNRSGKYIWFSSAGLPNGAGITSMPTVVLKNPANKRVWVTEGILKAETAANLINSNFIGVPGITNWKHTTEILQKLRPEQILVAFDQEDNPRTREQEELLCQEIAELGKVYKVAWDKEKGKGIDDFIRAEKMTEEELLDFFGIKPEEAGVAKKVLIRLSQIFGQIAENL